MNLLNFLYFSRSQYDWRLPYHILERRDGYFSWLRDQITIMVKRTGKMVVIMGHSMGNRVIHYFLNWLRIADPRDGAEWIKTHIHTFMAVGAPWLGATKTLRGTVRVLFYLRLC